MRRDNKSIGGVASEHNNRRGLNGEKRVRETIACACCQMNNLSARYHTLGIIVELLGSKRDEGIMSV
jgi:hypothetical protein